MKAKYGLIGKQLHYSLSPQIHHASFKINHIRAEYALYEVDESKSMQIVQALKTLGIDGVNVTMPYKQIVIPQLNEISEEAKKIGAVNTIKIKNGKAYGYNTDYHGILDMLDYGDIEIEGNDFYILGAGGSARSVIWCLKDRGASSVTIVTRDVSAASKALDDTDVNIINYDEFNRVESGYGVVNTTPRGLAPNVDDMAISEEKLRCFKAAIDLVYNPEETKFLKIAKRHGLKTTTGLYMLVAQATRAQEIWYDSKFD
ncbi:MAG: shikimate dehydrogenase [Epulopiscium sp. Nele67-Bin001]|nr:MAG: shikimate dehydrogenase [Epulopiscium sp. Nuni2H_MBin001]OON91713.1 MAG: shikimate dehydrogenase [Epulopiscium sp. Nele67-Bin001]